MTDYGVRPARRPVMVALLAHAAIVAAVALTAWIVGGTYLKDRRAAVATASDWSFAGPACPEISRAAFDAQGLKAPKIIEYDGLTVGRQAGHVVCTAVTYGGGKGFGTYPVCQLTSPAMVRAKSRGGERFFAPGFGKAVTVSAPKGEPHCVLAGDFRLN